ncbi:uroporphyrinogen-III synthase [Venatoribacter cucullus]|uniref:Uroporphyrinogen-III synthase n=1 Tax=Venatoribacter cucullus TaxID=2661630 RepID=A0A9E8JQS7_9GAMM|nr:uroporphyrinogen-III synthase [Venatoribacter cucullus]QQD25346.1 uroporphyrinogen-III synthase [Venatoribacter cucullus]UZK04740.1 uroporphyrinogen-III synthase [Venatoribacter cucullus]
MQPAVIVTRPAEQAGPLLQALQQRGYATRHLPLMDIVPLADDDAAATSGLRARLMNLDEYRAVIVISVNAATIGLEWLDRYWPQPPLGIEFYAVGPSTAEVLEQARLTVHCPAERFDSEGILALPGLQPEVIAGQKVLLWRGIGGREKLASVLRERGAQVDYAELYERREQHYSADQWQAALQDKPLLMLSSTQALDIVCAQVPDLPQRIQALILPAERSADMARERGFTRVLVAASARDEHMLACLPPG